MKTSFNHYIDKLNGEYKTSFNEILTYGYTVDVDNILFEEKMGELLDVFISAQEEENPVETIVGEDINTFCINFFSDIPKISHLKEFFDSIKRVAWFLLVIDILSFFIDLDAGTSTKSDVGAFMLIFLASYIFSRLVGIGLRKILFKTSLNYKLKTAVLVAFEIAVTLLITVVVFKFWADKFTVSVVVEMAVIAIYLVAYYFFNYKRLSEDKKVRGGESVLSSTSQQMEDQMLVKFEKENAKRERKGKAVCSWQEYLDKEEKITDQTKVLTKIMIFLPAVIVAVLVIPMFCSGEFSTVEDLVYFIAPILIIEYLIFIPMYKFFKYSNKIREDWAKKQRNK